jgi:elongation factor Ts
MAEITAALVKELREKSGAGMMDCKRALTESDGDLEAAFDGLRKKGLAAAAKKAGRVAAEGLVGVATAARTGAIVEVNSETDFVARNELFQTFVRSVAALAVSAERDVEALKAASFAGNGKTVEGELTDLIGRIGENLVLRRVARLTVGQGHVASYVHNMVSPGLGKIGVLVALESAASEDVLAPLGRQLAMHVAAANPQYLDQTAVPAAALDRERGVLRDRALESGKAAGIVERMVEGGLRKFYEDSVLFDQIYVVDGENKNRVGKVVEAAAKEAGTPITIAAFVRFALGEGIDRPTTDFAAEVGAQLGH